MDIRLVFLGLVLAITFYQGGCSADDKRFVKKRSHQMLQSFKRALQKRDDKCEDDEREWKCETGGCVDGAYVCDGEEDCDDGSDEKCDDYTCNPNMQFACPSGTPKCLMLTDVCNEVSDCAGGEDELDCEEDFECDEGSTLLIPGGICDSIPDCDDATDEDQTMCKDWTCNKAQFTCDNGDCIEMSFRCDWDEDCDDDSDEKNCAAP